MLHYFDRRFVAWVTTLTVGRAILNIASTKEINKASIRIKMMLCFFDIFFRMKGFLILCFTSDYPLIYVFYRKKKYSS